VPDLGTVARPFDPNAVKRDFPILQERVHGRPLIWLDNAATTQKPQAVIDRLSYYYEHENSNVHRAAHVLAARSTDAYEAARDKVRRFLNASSSKEIVFVRGTTEGINLVAQSWGRRNIGPGDEIVDHLARTPRQHRPLAAVVWREGRAPSRGAGRFARTGPPRGV
jgi:cysteine desulfurase/selenocysteine lyase